ncbi:ComEC/Rec2 family competence protein, partial [Ruminococcaceae bacterium OttesenSCG-928-D13]|nr:ComEC/Rec2 family competence protein [Ruminococcaceae bacterium OttesenSCG-928-D13]
AGPISGSTSAKVLRHALPLLAAGLLAAGLRFGHEALLVRPVRALAGSEPLVTARVLEVSPGYGDDNINATLRVLSVEGERASFKVQVSGLPIEAVPGDLLELRLRLYDYTSTASRVYGYGKGLFVGASPKGAVARGGESHTLFTRLRRLQYAAAENITARLPGRLGPVAAAMAVGDRRGVNPAITDAYRAAGASHLMVVSGLHLSLVCAMADALLASLRRRRPKAAAAAGICVVALFALFTGLTASVVRSGVVWLMLYTARLIGRQSDSLTALGLAGLLLVLQNPFAAANVGLLLSFSATLGALMSGQLNAWLRGRWRVRRARRVLEAGADSTATSPRDHDRSKFRTAAGWLAGKLWDTALVSLSVTAATLPVLVYAGMGFSLLGIPVNVLMVPLLPLVVVCGLVMAVPAGIPLLGWLGAPAALVCGLALRFFEILTNWCLAQRWAWVPVGGLFGLVTVLAVYALLAAGSKGRRLKVLAPAALGLAVGAFALHLAMNAGTVRVTAAGSGTNASLVVTSGGKAVVLYRSRLSAGAVERVFTRDGVDECVLLIDLRQTAESTEYLDRFAPQTVVAAGADLVAGGLYEPMAEVAVTVVRQGGGTAACVDVAGYKLGAYTGSVDLAGYAPLDALLAGGGSATGSYEALITGGAAPDWADPEAKILHSGGEATLWIRPGTSVVYREVENGNG